MLFLPKAAASASELLSSVLLRFLLRLGGTNETAINIDGFQQALTWIFAALEALKKGGKGTHVQESSPLSSAAKLAKSLTHDLEFPGLKRKHSVGSSPDSTSGKGAETAEYYQVPLRINKNILCFLFFSLFKLAQNGSVGTVGELLLVG